MTDPTTAAAKLLDELQMAEAIRVAKCWLADDKHGGVTQILCRAVLQLSSRPQPAPPADDIGVEIYLHSKEIAQTIADHTYWFCDICSNTNDECFCQPDALERGKKEIEHTLVEYGEHMYRLGLAARPKV